LEQIIVVFHSLSVILVSLVSAVIRLNMTITFLLLMFLDYFLAEALQAFLDLELQTDYDLDDGMLLPWLVTVTLVYMFYAVRGDGYLCFDVPGSTYCVSGFRVHVARLKISVLGFQ